MTEVYLDNDHLVDFRVVERSTGLGISDLQLTARLSRNPTGSAIQSFFLGGGTSSFVSASQLPIGTTTFIASAPLSGGVTYSIHTVTSQSLTTNFTGSNVGNVILTASLTETPVLSGQYIGTINGSDISTALSESLSSSFASELSSSTASASFDVGGLIVSAGVTTSVAFTASISGFTSSMTESILEQLVESDDRCFGVHEIIQSGTFLNVATPMTLRSVRFIP